MEPMCDHCHQYRSQHKPGGKGCAKFYWDPGPRRNAQELDALTAGPSMADLEQTISTLKYEFKQHKEAYGEVKVGTWHDGSPCALKHSFSFVEVEKAIKALPDTIMATVAPAVDEKLRNQIRDAIANDDPKHHPPVAGAVCFGYGMSQPSVDRVADIAARVVAAQPVTTNSSLEEWLCHEASYLMRDVGIDKEYSQRVVQSLMAAHARGTSDNEETAAFIAAQPSGEVTVFTEMATVSDKLNKLKYWELDGWQFTGYKFECGGSQCSIETACIAANEPPRRASIDDADTARLDFLIKERVVLFKYENGGYCLEWPDGKKIAGGTLYKNAREWRTARKAIDAAIQWEARTGGSDE